MEIKVTDRAGEFREQPSGYRAFVPRGLPPVPPVEIDGALQALLSEADRSLGRLDGITEILPDPDLFVSMFVRQEAVLSSQIEGTQSSLTDLLAFEAGQVARNPDDARQVVNYVRAMNKGIADLGTLPLSLRLIRSIHEELMLGVRGQHASPGEFRTSQNWIGSTGSTLSNATFVPPPVEDMKRALYDLENFLHAKDDLPALINCAVAHAQFETIHPFLDGNGRVGRLLITFQLVERGILQQPLLYLSHYFKRHRAEYYDRLMAVRLDGNWEAWIAFFLRGVSSVSREATATARDILALRESHLKLAGGIASKYSVPLLELLFASPVLDIRTIEGRIGCTYAQANSLVGRFESLGILAETTGQKRYRSYRYAPYLTLFDSGDIDSGDTGRHNGRAL